MLESIGKKILSRIDDAQLSAKVNEDLPRLLMGMLFGHDASKLVLVGEHPKWNYIQQSLKRSGISVTVVSAVGECDDCATGGGCLYCFPKANSVPVDFTGLATSLDVLVGINPDSLAHIGESLVLNTLENSFSNIVVYGSSPLSDLIFAYYLDSPSAVSVSRIARNDMAYESKEQCYVVDSAIDGRNTVIVFGDSVPYRKVRSTDDGTVYAVDLYMIMNSALNEGKDDIYENIVPILEKKGVHVVFMAMPHRVELHLSELQRFRLYKTNAHYLIKRKFRPNNYSEGEFKHLGDMELYEDTKTRRVDNRFGYPMVHTEGSLCRFSGGIRETVGNHACAKRRMFFFGPCILAGPYVRDGETIPSLVKKHLDDEWAVINKATFNGRGLGCLIRQTGFRPGDVVFIMTTESGHMLSKRDFDYLDLVECFDGVPRLDKHVCDALFHCDAVVNREVADCVCKHLSSRNLLGESNIVGDARVIVGSAHKCAPRASMLDNEDLASWLREIHAQLPETISTRGAIVMNCNPFTLGHRYLIESAAKRVETLVVFVVREDKSYFPFEDRLDLVKEGCKDLANVVVAQSGAYMISSQTLPGYFEKDTLGSIMLNADSDISLFATIARELSISVRFAGEEPTDMFTNQYNENMASILPDYGIDFIEIPRRSISGEVISASKVRNALRNGDWKTISDMVPDTTYRYLEERFK